MEKPQFVYVTYIRTTPEKLWQALTQPEFTRRYWCDSRQESEWKKGASWRIVIPDGRDAASGEVLEIDPPRRLVLSWRDELRPEWRAEGFSRLAYDLEKQGDTVKLTVTHQVDKPGSKLLQAVSGGWPQVLASLKSLIETGEALAATKEWPKDGCKSGQ
jgi:uncharacterized protein YndB with AHSA1/START domain